jgi:hypothetical protein
MQNSKKYVICGIGAKGAIGTTIGLEHAFLECIPIKLKTTW